jgi:hypothetical protein
MTMILIQIQNILWVLFSPPNPPFIHYNRQRLFLWNPTTGLLVRLCD